MSFSNIELLRMRAERVIEERAQNEPRATNSAESMEAIVHELEVHQAELEIQNESLRETEVALRQACDRYFDQFDLAPMPYIILDEDGAVEEANLATASLLRCERYSLIHKRISRFVAPHEVNRFHLYRRELVERGLRQRLELTIRRKDGTLFPARLESIAVHDADEGRRHIRMALMDLTEIARAKTEVERGAQQLDLPQAHLDSVARSMLDSLVLLDRDGVIRSVNPATLSLLDYAEDELIGQPFGKIMEGVGQGKFAAQEAGMGVLGRAEKVYIAKNGRRISVDFSGSPVRGDRSATVEAIVCTAHDVTEVRRKDQQLRLTVEASPVAMLMVDEQQNIVMLNAKSEELFGYAREELMGLNIDTLVPMDFASEHRRHVETYLREPVARKMGRRRELNGLRKDGSLIPVEVALSPFEMPDGVRVLAAIGDLSERKRLEDELRQVQKMEAIGTLASGVAHDFNNLLMGVSGCANIALSTLDANNPATMYLDEIKKSAASGAAISRQLLAFSSRREIEVSVFELNVVVSNAQKMLKRLLGEDIRAISRFGAKDSRVRSDPGQIEQILINLAVNARDAMPGGGELLIETSRISLTEPNERSLPAGEYVILRVTDDGIGMTEEVRSRVFEPFFTTKELGRGTGLGLSVVYGITKRAGGYIEVTSQPNEGTTFQVLLPADRRPVTKPLTIPDCDTAEQPPTFRTILLLEDERTVRMATRFYLERGGFNVLEAGSGSEAIECCQKYPGRIDLLLSDVVLPGMNGPSAAKEIQKLKPGIEIVYMSAHASEWLAAEGRIESAVRTLQKPFGAGALLARIHETLDGAQALKDTSSHGPNAELDECLAESNQTEREETGRANEHAGEHVVHKKSVLVVEDTSAARLAILEYLEREGWQVASVGSGHEAMQLVNRRDHDFDVLLVDYSLIDTKGDILAGEIRSALPDISIAYMSELPELDVYPNGPVLEKPLDLELLCSTLEDLLA